MIGTAKTRFCPAEEYGYDAKECTCSKHRKAFYARPEVQRGLLRALAAPHCEGTASYEDDTPCTRTDNLTPIMPGAYADNGDVVFFMLCPKCRMMC